ncbi:hypothetical protein [Xanthocytophaga flava]|uniref:hypothetical protein n=1 Tax=Xanthocytophaga flava TaxID=3048013 RepID=UPI0028D597D4|nr:hypothetical protein [Xanthocytophaga flavus]MDJ1467753.1 hypothetical protein [Xanthocytophaga flavus]
MKSVCVRLSAISGCFVLIWILACNRQHTITSQEIADAQTIAIENVQLLAIVKDVLDITQKGLLTEGLLKSNNSTNQHTTYITECNPVMTSNYTNISHNGDTLTYSGTITMDYGDGSACADSLKTPKGKLIDTFFVTIIDSDINKRSPSVSYLATISFENFQKDNIILSGTITSQSVDQITTVTSEDARLTYTDGSSTFWNGALTYVYHPSEYKEDDCWIISGSLTGISRIGTAFMTSISKDIIYTGRCQNSGRPVSGNIEIISNGVTSVTDYGNGICDTLYTVTVREAAKKYKSDI